MTAYRTGPLPEAPPVVPQWNRALLAMIAWVVGNFIPIPLPGVDSLAARELMQEGERGFGSLTHGPLLPLLGSSLSSLVLVRAALALFTHDGDPERQRRWYRNGAVIYLALAAAQGFSLALWLEGSRTSDLISLVPSPGWDVRLGVIAATTVSAALAWQLATMITRTRAAHGPMALLLADTVARTVPTWLDVGRSIAHDTAPISQVGVALVGCAPTALLLVALWRWSPRSWPQRVVRGVEALSPIDLLPLPLIAGAKAVALARLAHVASPNVELVAGLLAGLACVALLAVWLRRREAHARQPLALMVACALPLAVLAVVGASMVVEAKGLPAHVVAELWPFRPSIVVELRGEGPHPMADAIKIAARMREMHHRAVVVEATSARIRLRVTPAQGEARDLVAAALRPGKLEFYRAADDQTAVSPSGGEPIGGLTTRIVGREMTTIYEGPSIESLAPVVARSEAVPGAVTRVGCDDPREPGGASHCYALRLEPTPALTNRDVDSARVTLDPSDNQPRVSLEFTDEGATAFAEVTRRSVRHILAIVVDDRINSIPIVMQEITGGHAIISMGNAGDFRTSFAEANALAAALSSGSLEGRWSLARLAQPASER